MAYYVIRLIICKLLWHFDVELDGENENWISDQRIFGTWEKLPLMVKLHPVIRA
jgi:hypothetical protein